MNCLCCGKPLLGEKEAGWHKICIKKFFDTRQIPEIEIDEKTLDKLAAESTNSGFTVRCTKEVVTSFVFGKSQI